jgi:GAF domain-containing protein/HAMP domain-containing protein
LRAITQEEQVHNEQQADLPTSEVEPGEPTMTMPKTTSRHHARGSPGRWALPLAARFLLALVVAAVIPVMVVSAAQIASNLTALRTEVRNLQLEATRNAANVIDAYLERFEDEMRLAVRDGSLPASGSPGLLLDGLLTYNAGFETLTLMDNTGQEIAKTSRYLQFSGQDLINQADSPEFVAAIQADRYLGPVSFSQDAEPLVTLAVPVKDAGGQVEGVLSAEINLKYMWDIIGRLETSLGSYAYVVDGDGRLLAHRDSSLVLQGRNLSRLQGVQYAMQGRELARSYTGLEGQTVIGAYQGLRRADWFVLVEAPARQALATIYRSLFFSIAAVLGTLVLAILLGRRLARFVVRPVQSLQEGVEIIGAGNLEHRIEIRTRDEIGTLASAFNAMAGELQQMIGTLEQRVADRTHELEHRARQLATAAEVGRAAASILDLGTMSSQVVDLICGRFNLYYAGLFLLDATGDQAVLQAGSGEAGRIMKAAGHSLRVGGLSMVGAACAQHQARIALDVGEEPVRFDNPLLPETRSEMALPLLVGDRVLGALDVQSTRPAAFSEEDIAVLQLVADQVAVAVDNARKFSDEAALLDATNPLFRVSRRLTAAATTDQVVQTIIDAVAATEADGCAVAHLALSPAGDVEATTFLAHWDRRDIPRFPLGVPLPASTCPFPPKMATRFWTVEDILQDAQVPEASRYALARSGTRAFVNLPLQAGNETVGYMSVQRAMPGPFSAVSIRLYETVADQAAAALERTRLLEQAQNRAARERMVGEVAARMRETLDVDSVLQTAARGIRQALNLHDITIRLEHVEDPGPILLGEEVLP